MNDALRRERYRCSVIVLFRKEGRSESGVGRGRAQRPRPKLRPSARRRPSMNWCSTSASTFPALSSASHPRPRSSPLSPPAAPAPPPAASHAAAQGRPGTQRLRQHQAMPCTHPVTPVYMVTRPPKWARALTSQQVPLVQAAAVLPTPNPSPFFQRHQP